MASIKTILLENFHNKLHPKRSLIFSGFFGLGIGTTFFIILTFIILVTHNKIAPFFFDSTIVSWSFNNTNTFLLNCSLNNASEISNVSILNDQVEKTHVVNLDIMLKNVSFHGLKSNNGTESGNFSIIEDELRKTHVVNLGFKLRNDSLKSKVFTGGTNDSRNSENFNITNVGLRNLGQIDDVNLLKGCNIFDGKWVRDDDLPHYPPGSCPYIDRDFNCYLNGRPDDGFYRWKWQPFGCNIPRLNATDFLERMRGRKLVFVGDSLNRNMWESLVCILWYSVKDKKKVYEVSGRRQFKKEGLYAVIYEDYNCSIDYVRAPFLVRESTFQKQNESLATLRLDLMDQTTKMYHDADVMIFNTAHWWTHEKTSRGEEYYQEGNYVYPRLKALKAYRKALTTWGKWVDRNINYNRTLVFFRGYSGIHFRGGQWNSGGKCHNETEPIFNDTYLTRYPSKMRVLEHVLGKMKTPVMYLNISRMTDYRKDGHPSIYRKTYERGKNRSEAEHTQDCSHWCLPGVPDLWNELLYASLLKIGWGYSGQEMRR